MDDILIKYSGAVDCSSIGSKNPAVALIAQMMMSDMQLVSQQAQEVSAQSVGHAASRAASLGI